MPKIVVGDGSAMALLEVFSVPNDGDKRTIEESEILRGASENTLLLTGDTFWFKGAGTIRVKGEEEEIPRFSIYSVALHPQCPGSS